MPAAAQSIVRFKGTLPRVGDAPPYGAARGPVKAPSCDLDYRGGRTRRPRTAAVEPSSAATSASSRRAPSARQEFITTAHRMSGGVATVDRRGRPARSCTRPGAPATGSADGSSPADRRSRSPTSSARRTCRAPTGTPPTTSRSPTATPAGRTTATSTRAYGRSTPRRRRRSGYDFHQIWPDGPAAPGAALLRLDPWRLHVADAMTVAAPRVWKADTAYR